MPAMMMVVSERERSVSRKEPRPYDGREFIAYLDEVIRRNEWNQADLAQRVGVSPSIVSRWTRGSQPTIESVQRLVQALGADEDELLRMTGYRRQPASDDPVAADLIAKIRLIRLTEERQEILDTLLEKFRRRDEQQRPSD